MPSDLPLGSHLPTPEGWTAELAASLWFVVLAMGFEPTRVEPTRFQTLRLNHTATPPDRYIGMAAIIVVSYRNILLFFPVRR